jgi:ankyrin repeat protein
MLLDHSVNPDILNRNKQVIDQEESLILFLKLLVVPFLICIEFVLSQTPLMLAAMHGKIECVNKLLESGANVSSLFFSFLQFDL